MKILVDSNDGKVLTRPCDLHRSYFIIDLDIKSAKLNNYASREIQNITQNVSKVKNISELLKIIKGTDREVTFISRDANKQTLATLKKSGANVYVTFKNRIDEAISQVLQDKMIHEYMVGN